MFGGHEGIEIEVGGALGQIVSVGIEFVDAGEVAETAVAIVIDV